MDDSSVKVDVDVVTVGAVGTVDTVDDSGSLHTAMVSSIHLDVTLSNNNRRGHRGIR